MVQDTLLDSFRAGRRNYTIFQVGKATLLRVSDVMKLKSAFKDRPRAYQETQAEAVAYVAMQNIGVDTSN